MGVETRVLEKVRGRGGGYSVLPVEGMGRCSKALVNLGLFHLLSIYL